MHVWIVPCDSGHYPDQRMHGLYRYLDTRSPANDHLAAEQTGYVLSWDIIFTRMKLVVSLSDLGPQAKMETLPPPPPEKERGGGGA